MTERIQTLDLPRDMQAMILARPGDALQLVRRPVPRPTTGQVLVRVLACAVCRTDLHIVDGELTDPKLPLIPGHEIVGEVVAQADNPGRFRPGQRVGIPWLGWTCGQCEFCRAHRENLCIDGRFTGYHIDGGYAQFTVADARYCFPISSSYGAAEAAPLLCAGLIGFRCLEHAGAGERIGIYGFGAAAHIVAQLARHQGRQIFAFTRPGDTQAQDFARRLGAVWAGGSDERPAEALDCAIIFAPVGSLVPAALQAVKPGGTVVCGGIFMSDIPAFPYDWLWREKRVVSVANLTRADGKAFLSLAGAVPIRTEVECFPLEAANQALERLRRGQLTGAAVLVPTGDGQRTASGS